MSKGKTIKPSMTRSNAPPAAAGAGRRALLNLCGFIAFASVLVAAVVTSRRYVDQRVAAPVGPLKVVLLNKPAWMSEFLAQQIAATVPRAASSAFDHELLVAAAEKLRQNPWVRDVHFVRRVYGERPGDTLEVDCEFRAPIALVQWGDYYWLVDGDGMKLPEQFTGNHVPRIVLGRNGRMNVRIIEGVKQPPPATGQRWAGADLSAGLGLVKLLYGKSYAEELVTVNVANFGGRKDAREAQLVLRTKYGTEVRWGRPLDAKDFFAEVPVSQKLDSLKSVVEQYGRVDAGQPWIDIRYDRITYPKPAGSGEDGAAARVDGGR
jgi:hypothetical protein